MIIDYFYLKFYNGILKSSIPEFPRFMASLFFGCIVNIDILHINALLAKLDIMPYILDKTSILIGSIVISTLFFLRYNNTRFEAIRFRFTSSEFKPKKRKLNIFFILWLVITILASFLLPLYKPGYLPKL